MPETIDLYYWPTPNGWKVSIALEELGLPYNVVPVNIGTGDQFEPKFLEISPNNKMPAIVDPEGPDGQPISLFESGAILLYLAEKTGKLFPTEPRARFEAMQWLMFQMGGVGPMLGQAHHFRQYAPETIPYAVDRYTNEAARLYGVMDRHLEGSEYFAGDEYTIVDIAVYGWVVPHENQGQDLNDFPNLKRWFDAVSSRPAVQRGIKVGEELRYSLNDLDEDARSKLFGNKPSGS